MADDIDDLLDEVESKYCDPAKKAAPVKKTAIINTQHRTRNMKGDDDLNAIIDDIIDTPEPVVKLKPGVPSVSGSSAPSAVGAKGTSKCYPVYLGGSSCENGKATSMNKRSCDKLRCTDCDFSVSAFDNFHWHSSTDYLFLRNNVPDFPKLRAKLIPKKGYRAYACQCKWKSVINITDLQTDPQLNLKWVCGKH